MKKLILLAISVMFLACTYHSGPENPVTPVSYPTPTHRNADSIGILRRMAIMPVDLESVTNRNDSIADLANKAIEYEKECARYLNKEKGYDIVLARNSKSAWRKALSVENGYRSTREMYQSWRSSSQKDIIRSTVQEIGHTMNVDGLIVIRIKERRPWNALDGILNIALMNIPLFYRLSAANIGAWIYETTSGRMVWRTEQAGDFGQENDRPSVAMKTLFYNMENAVPPHMIK